MLDSLATQANLERRGRPRIACTFPAILRGNEATGQRFQEVAQLRNLSASGIYLKSKRPLPQGQTILLVFWFSSHPKPAQVGALAARGIVVRTETHADGSHGIALKLQRHRFM